MIHVEKKKAPGIDRKTQLPVSRDSRVARFVTATNGKDYAVTIAPDGVLIRERGRRTTYTVPYTRLHLLGGQLMAEMTRGEKPRRRRKPGGLLRGR
jgi:hypothetical protein